MNQTLDLGKDKISRLLLAFSVPSIISWVLNALYNMVDQIFIGNGVGYLGNGATNVIFPLTQLAIAIGLMIGDGTASYVNLKLGVHEQERAEKGMAGGLLALLTASIALSVVLSIFWNRCVMFSVRRKLFCRMRWITDELLLQVLVSICSRGAR